MSRYRYIRVVFHVNLGKGEYQTGLPYDVADTPEVRALIRSGRATHIPYQ